MGYPAFCPGVPERKKINNNNNKNNNNNNIKNKNNDNIIIIGKGSRRKEGIMFYTTESKFRCYKERKVIVLCNDTLKTFYLWLYERKEMFYLTTHSTHFIYGYIASDIW